MTRAIICVLDSFGIGGAPDAAAYGDVGANTLGHIANFCAAGKADRPGLRAGPLSVPNMAALGLGLAGRAASGEAAPGLENIEISGLWGHARETSTGKDTPSGHWEICGVPVPFAWRGFPPTIPSFPQDITEALIREGQLPGILGDCHASGTEIIARFGEEHLRTGKPILYTSLDSVMQIAAHEETFGLERLYTLCAIARRLLDPLNVGRVIARPFLGNTAETFKRTPNRKDWSVPPIAPTLLDHCAAANMPVTTIGKIGDIFAHRATGREIKAAGNMALFDRLIEIIEEPTSSGFIFANFVDFDTEFGHRRDVAGYALALEAFDRRLPELAARLRPGDVCILTADHGCDPTWPGTDHTREQVPVLAFGPGIGTGSIGARESFADIGASVAAWLGVPAMAKGTSFLPQMPR